MDFLSVSSLIAALVGAATSLAAFILVPRLKSSGGTRRHFTYVAATTAAVIAAASFASLWLADRKASSPGNVSIDVPPGRHEPASAPATTPPILIGVPAAPERVTTVERISETLDAHDSVLGTTTRQYVRRFEAKPGFRIVEAKFNERSATRVSGFVVESTGQTATVRFSLTSGPAVDRYRGWIDGELTLVQERIVR